MDDSLFESGAILMELIGSAIAIGIIVWVCLGSNSQLSQLTARFLTGLM